VAISSRKSENVATAISDLKREGLSVLGIPCHVVRSMMGYYSCGVRMPYDPLPSTVNAGKSRRQDTTCPGNLQAFISARLCVSNMH
jgi:hypothetical protein